MRDFKHLHTFESFVEIHNQETIEEGAFGDFARNIGRKIGVLELTDEQKATEILATEDKLLDAIQNSSNPKLHMENYNLLKGKENKMPFYKFVVFLNDNINDLINKRPLYYQIGDFGVKDMRILNPINPAGT